MDLSSLIFLYLIIGVVVQIILVETHPRKKKVLRDFSTWKRITAPILGIVIFPISIVMTLLEDRRLKNEVSRDSRTGKRIRKNS